MNSKLVDPRSPLPTRFVCPKHRFTEHEVFAFIIAQLINPDILLMRGPRYPDFAQHPDWIVCGYDAEYDDNRGDDAEGVKKYGPFGHTFAKYWPYLVDANVLMSEAACDIVDRDFITKIDYDFVYHNAGGVSYTMHSHMVDLFNPFDEHSEDPGTAHFTYDDDEAFAEAAEIFRPILVRQFYWANNLIQERTMVEKVIANAEGNFIQIDDFFDMSRVKTILQDGNIRWVLHWYDGVRRLHYVEPKYAKGNASRIQRAKDAVVNLMREFEGIVTIDASNVTATFNVQRDVQNFVKAADTAIQRFSE